MQDVDGLLVGEVVVVGPGATPRRHLVEAAPELLPTRSRTKGLAAVAERLPVRLLDPLQLVLVCDVWVAHAGLLLPTLS